MNPNDCLVEKQEQKRLYDKQRYYANKEKLLAQNKIWRDSHKEQRRKYGAEWYKNNSVKVAQYRNKNYEKQWANKIQLIFGITSEKYYEMEKTQNYKCKICGTDHPQRKNSRGKWNIDHCHKTNKIRGLLCHRCNAMLGLCKDNPDILLEAVKYLNES